MRDPIEQLGAWLRSEFVRINTELEEAYFGERVQVISGRRDLDALKLTLLRQGGPIIDAVGNMSPLPTDRRDSYRLLGMVGYYLAACQRHEAPLSDSEGARQSAWCICLRIGSSLGVAPRYVFAHQALFNDAAAGRFRTFTSLADEEVFIRLNALGVLAYRRAANALRDVAAMGVSNPVATYLFDDALAALRDVLRFNQALSQQLNVDRFFFNIRPYFKTYRVAGQEYRGANAGDFAAINEIDVMLGLCRTDDFFYQSIVHEKRGYVPPEDQRALRMLDSQPSLLERFLSDLETRGTTPMWNRNATRFLEVCKMHGAAYAYHHHRLVKPYLEVPAQITGASGGGLTSSGPPLAEVVAALERLLHLRTARAPLRALLDRLGEQ